MRIVGGEFGGRRFAPPSNNWPTRPTTDFAKEALYNILHHTIDFSEVKMLDLFGGTGNHCYEALSRGCTDVTYVDRHGPCLAFVKKTAIILDVMDRIKIVRSDVDKFIRNSTKQYDFIFADPPYASRTLSSLPDDILNKGMLAEDGLLVVEHNKNNDFEEHERCYSVRKYGGSIFSFFA